MGSIEPPSEQEAIDRLLEAGDLEEAREILSGAPTADESYSVLRIKLALLEGSLPPQAAMQSLIQLMRQNPKWPGAKELYQFASRASFASRESSAAHSHFPPPVKNKS